VKPDPLAPDLAKLFREEPLPVAPPGVEERVATQLTAAGAFAASGAGAAATATALTKLLPIATFVLGAGAGAAVLATVSEPKERVVYVERAAPSVSVAPVDPPPTTDVPSISLSALPSVASAPVAKATVSASVSTPAQQDDLRDERILLDTSRAKLSSGDPKAALALIETHEQKFAKGRLVEEREAIAVQALVNAGRYDEAKKRADALEKRFPTSVYLPAVKITLESIP